MKNRTKRQLGKELKRLINYKESIQRYGFTNSEYETEAKNKIKIIQSQIENITKELGNFKSK